MQYFKENYTTIFKSCTEQHTRITINVNKCFSFLICRAMDAFTPIIISHSSNKVTTVVIYNRYQIKITNLPRFWVSSYL